MRRWGFGDENHDFENDDGEEEDGDDAVQKSGRLANYFSSWPLYDKPLADQAASLSGQLLKNCTTSRFLAMRTLHSDFVALCMAEIDDVE